MQERSQNHRCQWPTTQSFRYLLSLLGVMSKFQRVHFVDNFNMHANLCQLTLYIIYTGSVFAHSLGPSQPNGVLFNPLLVISRFTRFTWNRSVAVPTMGEWWYRWYAFNSHAFGSDVCHRWILTFKNPSCLFYSGSCCTFVAWGKMQVKYRRGLNPRFDYLTNDQNKMEGVMQTNLMFSSCCDPLGRQNYYHTHSLDWQLDSEVNFESESGKKA